mmetsp:Transcript_42354/g.77395  ORF Transcript_42354/g.77395 Transcript_42354/m.77395 type:complete len:93 (-) Transcript_42354:175-453(-)
MPLNGSKSFVFRSCEFEKEMPYLLPFPSFLDRVRPMPSSTNLLLAFVLGLPEFVSNFHDDTKNVSLEPFRREGEWFGAVGEDNDGTINESKK